MLILTRKVGEAIDIGGEVRVSVVEIKSGQVKLGIHAPRSIDVHRHEVYLKIQEENLRASRVSMDALGEVEGLIIKNKIP
ncbi:MAG: carbon storage regulator CsrA [Thermodesulfobacteriota bacterium]|nr:carbon storage regulator CsrA [Thermodesulfobacteriota bacterium]